MTHIAIMETAPDTDKKITKPTGNVAFDAVEGVLVYVVVLNMSTRSIQGRYKVLKNCLEPRRYDSSNLQYRQWSSLEYIAP